MSEKRCIKATHEQHAALDWAFSTINEFMLMNDLCVLKSRNLNLVVTYLGAKDE